MYLYFLNSNVNYFLKISKISSLPSFLCFFRGSPSIAI